MEKKSTYTEAAKQSMYEWRRKNPDKYKNCIKKYLEENREKIQKNDLERKNTKYANNEDFKNRCKTKALARYYYKKELELYMNILLD